MTYRSILVQLDVNEPAAGRVKVATALAERLDAKLIGFAAASFHPMTWADSGAVFDSEFIETEQRNIDERLAQLKDEFHDLAGARADGWRIHRQPPTGALLDEARSADLVVSASPNGASTGDIYQTVDLGAFVMGAGRPLLVVAEGSEALAGDTVVVAWKDTREARRAVLDAVPLLGLAKDVVVAVVDEPGHPTTEASTGDLVRYLERHAISARVELLERGDSDIADCLLAAVQEIGADVIVSGAYGHSRMREWAFGGVTRSLLESNTVHRFLSN